MGGEDGHLEQAALEQMLWVHRFATIAELLEALHTFKKQFNEEWLIQRHGHVSPHERRQ